ncbi:MAG: hypothetical protein GF331_05515 [Chitinivibrionales bacterium]|nr:hypothetical protein [Chitinivibrionales bacterium]
MNGSVSRRQRKERQFVTCFLEGSLYGIDVLLVREICRCDGVVPVDLAPRSMIGLMNLRGQIVTVMDLAARMGLKGRGEGRPERAIVLKTDAELASIAAADLHGAKTGVDLIGLAVDAVGDLVTVDGSQILPPPSNMADLAARYLSGVVKLDDTLMGVLEVATLSYRAGG